MYSNVSGGWVGVDYCFLGGIDIVRLYGGEGVPGGFDDVNVSGRGISK